MTTITNPTLAEVIHAARLLDMAGACNTQGSGIHVLHTDTWLSWTAGNRRTAEPFKGGPYSWRVSARVDGECLYAVLTEEDYTDLVERGEL